MMAGSTRGASGSMRCSMCRVWWRALKWLPVLLIVTIVGWSYYAYVVQLCFLTVPNAVERIAYLVPYHILLVLFMWAYARTIYTDMVSVPAKFKLPASEMEKLLAAESEDSQRLILEHFAHDLPVVTRTMSGAIRYCNRCMLVKPDRAHHCSMCGVCVLKMDHHCPWVNNCVCFHNYKYFMLFLGYAFSYCIFVVCTALQYFIQFWRVSYYFVPFVGALNTMKVCDKFDGLMKANCYELFQDDPGSHSKFPSALSSGASSGQFHVVFVFFVALMFGISLASLFGYHCYLVLHNRTTLEAFRAPMFRSGADKNGFSIGTLNNFKEVFGRDPKLWFIPIFTSCGEGSEFPVRSEHRQQPFAPERGYEAMGTTRASAGEGVSYPQRRPDEDTESLLSSERWDRSRADNLDSSSFDEALE